MAKFASKQKAFMAQAQDSEGGRGDCLSLVFRDTLWYTQGFVSFTNFFSSFFPPMQIGCDSDTTQPESLTPWQWHYSAWVPDTVTVTPLSLSPWHCDSDTTQPESLILWQWHYSAWVPDTVTVTLLGLISPWHCDCDTTKPDESLTVCDSDTTQPESLTLWQWHYSAWWVPDSLWQWRYPA